MAESEDALGAAEASLRDALEALERAKRRQTALEEELCQAARISEEAARAQYQAHRAQSVPRNVRARTEPSHSSALSSEIVVLRLGEEEVSAHFGVLQQSPYFAARLERWDTGTAVDVALPEGCDVADMLAVLQQLYSPQAAWEPTADALTLLRCAAIADLWQLDSLLPGLAKAIRSRTTAKDALEVRELLSVPWPASFLEPLRPMLREGPGLDSAAARQMLKGAMSSDASSSAFEAARAIVASHSGSPLADALADVALQVVDAKAIASVCPRRMEWLLEALRDHADVREAYAVYSKLACLQASVRCAGCWCVCPGASVPQPLQMVCGAAFDRHLERCSDPEEAAAAFSLGVLRLGSCPCGAALSDNLLAFSSGRAGALLRLASASPQVRAGLVGALLQLDPQALQPLASVELLSVLPADDQRALVLRLCADLAVLRRWALGHCWPRPVQKLSELGWPASSLTELLFARRRLARLPWAAAEPAAQALQPYLAGLPADVCSLLVPLCGHASSLPSQSPNKAVEQQSRLIACGAAVVSVQAGLSLCLALTICSMSGFILQSFEDPYAASPSFVQPTWFFTIGVVFAETLAGLRGVLGVYFLAEPLLGAGAEFCIGLLGLSALSPLPDLALKYYHTTVHVRLPGDEEFAEQVEPAVDSAPPPRLRRNRPR